MSASSKQVDDEDVAADSAPLDTSDGRRARMGDVLAVRAKLEAALDRIGDLEARQAAGRMTRHEFIGRFMVALAASGRKANLWRAECEKGWADYNAACDGTPVPTVQELYGGDNLGKDVHAPLPTRSVFQHPASQPMAAVPQ